MKVFIQCILGILIAAMLLYFYKQTDNIWIGFISFLLASMSVITFVYGSIKEFSDVFSKRETDLNDEPNDDARKVDFHVSNLPDQKSDMQPGSNVKVTFTGRNKYGLFGYGPDHIICVPHRNSTAIIENRDVWECLIVAVHEGKNEGSKYLIVNPRELLTGA